MIGLLPPGIFNMAAQGKRGLLGRGGAKNALGGAGMRRGIFSFSTTPSPPTVSISTGPVFTWSPVIGAATYKLYRSVHSAGSYVVIRSGITGVTTYDSSNAANTSYDYYVTAVNTVGESIASNVVVLPAAVLNLANLVDLSSNGSHLSLNGTDLPTIVSNPIGIGQSALQFTADDQWAVGYGPDFALPSGDWTLEVSIARSVTQGAAQVILGIWKAANYYYLLYFDIANKLNWWQSPSLNPLSGAPITSSIAITNTSAHALCVESYNGNTRLYIDGVVVGGPSATPTNVTPTQNIRFLLGQQDDGDTPYIGTLGEFRLSDVARYSGASYTPATTPFTTDADTLALIPMSSLQGQYLGAQSYQGNALIRTGIPAAVGGEANPDGPMFTLDGNWFFSASFFNNTFWTVWGITAPTLTALLSQGGTVGAAAIQTPSGEGDLAGNGTVIPWNGTYYHYYHDNPGGGVSSIRYSTGNDLGAPFSPQPGNIIFQGGVGGYDVYADPWVRPSASGTTLVMTFVGQIGGDLTTRVLLQSTSSNGTTWSNFSLVQDSIQYPYYEAASGEPSIASQLFCNDGSHADALRRICMWSGAGGGYAALSRILTPTGSDANGNPYITVFDSSPYYDVLNSRLIFLFCNSTLNQLAQPTDSDIGVIFVPVISL